MTEFQKRPDFGASAQSNRAWTACWPDLQAAGWERHTEFGPLWHLKWGYCDILKACRLQDAYDLKRGRIACAMVAVGLAMLWLILME